MSRTILLFGVTAAMAGGLALAQEAKEPGGSLERRLERIEQAIARIDKKLSARGDGGMMEGCRDMMGGGMMRGPEGRRAPSPNDQWRNDPAR